jgi:hypothetical protein
LIETLIHRHQQFVFEFSFRSLWRAADQGEPLLIFEYSGCVSSQSLAPQQSFRLARMLGRQVGAAARIHKKSASAGPLCPAAEIDENNVVTHTAQNFFEPFFATEPPMSSSPDYHQRASAQDSLQAKISVAAETRSNGQVLLFFIRSNSERTLLPCSDAERYRWFVKREATSNDLHLEQRYACVQVPCKPPRFIERSGRAFFRRRNHGDIKPYIQNRPLSCVISAERAVGLLSRPFFHIHESILWSAD